MNLLVFFALPLATILLSIVLQTVLKCPILVGITFFAIYLIIAFYSILVNKFCRFSFASFIIIFIHFMLLFSWQRTLNIVK